MLVGLAGPASNLLQALLGTALVALFLDVAWPWASAAGLVEAAWWVVRVLTTYVYVNLVLCFFNLIPIPPLDGSKVVLYFLTGKARRTYYELQQYAMVLLIVVLYVLPVLFHVDPLGAYLEATAGNLYDLLLSAV